MACSGGICRLLSRTFGASPFAVLPLKNVTRHVVARSLSGMIVGNPNTGKRTATAAVALLLMLILVTAIISSRKKTVPAKEPPLHPPVAILAIF